MRNKLRKAFLKAELARLRKYAKAWEAEGRPSPLSYALRFTAMSAAVRRRCGESAMAIVADLYLAAEAFVEDCTPEIRSLFLTTIERRIDDALQAVAAENNA